MKTNSRFDPVPLWYVAECMSCGEKFDSETAARHHAEEHDNTHAITMDPGEGRRVELRRRNIGEFIESKFHESFDGAMDSFMDALEREYLDGSLGRYEVYGILKDILDNRSISETARSRWIRFTLDNDDRKGDES